MAVPDMIHHKGELLIMRLKREKHIPEKKTAEREPTMCSLLSLSHRPGVTTDALHWARFLRISLGMESNTPTIKGIRGDAEEILGLSFGAFPALSFPYLLILALNRNSLDHVFPPY